MCIRYPLVASIALATLMLAGCETRVGQPEAGTAASTKAVSGDHPPIFDTRSYAEARKAAESEKRWLIVKATAVWCGPCKQMDKTTWRNETVVAWLKEHAIAVAVDVDQESATAKDLGIEAMPTMIAFHDGKEVDRIVGYRTPEDFLVWLQGIEKGRKGS